MAKKKNILEACGYVFLYNHSYLGYNINFVTKTTCQITPTYPQSLYVLQNMTEMWKTWPVTLLFNM